MSRTENVELAVVCLLEDGGRVLLQNRKKEDWHGWALPGGHVEPGESFVDAAIREMLHMMNTPELTEFQYLLRGDEWIMSIK